MTSDAKIGLLLGLVFIFAIAFIINGLPSLRRKASNNELTGNMVGSYDNPAGIAARERKVSREVANRIRLAKKRPVEVRAPLADNQNVRFTTPLPKIALAVKEIVEIKSVAPARPLPATKKKESRKVKPSKPTTPRIYVVSDGDSLWRIAAEQLGSGSRYAEIARLNVSVIDDEDFLPVGMRLKLPVR